MRHSVVNTVGSLLGGFALLSIGCNSDWSDEKVEASKAQALKLVTAIDQYVIAKGMRPDTLRELVPDQLPEIELPIAGNHRWIYYRNREFYTIGFARQGDGPPCWFYSTEDRSWGYDDGD